LFENIVYGIKQIVNIISTTPGTFYTEKREILTNLFGRYSGFIAQAVGKYFPESLTLEFDQALPVIKKPFQNFMTIFLCQDPDMYPVKTV
jgi:hypothetical protein